MKPDIRSYHDPIAFLKDWFAYKKAAKGRFTVRAFARRAGFSSAFFPQVLLRKRPLTEKALEKVLPHLDLSPSEASFFRSLRAMGQSKDLQERSEGFHAIQNFRTYRRMNPKEFEVSRYFSRWFYVTIREMAELEHFKLDAEWISRRLVRTVPLAEIKKAIRFLKEHGFIEVVDKQGRVSTGDKHIQCEGNVYRVALTEFHIAMLALGADSLHRVEREKRHVSGFTIGMDADTYQKVTVLFEETMQKIRELSQANPSRNAVYHVTMAAFPTAHAEEA
ncbi:MAG: TIGR02147 family protein [Bacteriovoracia bacterium]